MSFLCEVFSPDAGLRSDAAAPCAAVSADETVLLDILRPEVALAMWLRPVPAGWGRLTAPLLAAAPFGAAAEGSPDAAVEDLFAALGLPLPAGLAADIAQLAHVFAAIARREEVRIRLEGVTHDSCRRFHVDSVGLRLLCTYRGPGTQWTMCGPDCPAPHAAPACAVLLLKGSRHDPPAPPDCLHRSPPVSRLPENRRARLLLRIDEPGIFR